MYIDIFYQYTKSSKSSYSKTFRPHRTMMTLNNSKQRFTSMKIHHLSINGPLPINTIYLKNRWPLHSRIVENFSIDAVRCIIRINGGASSGEHMVEAPAVTAAVMYRSCHRHKRSHTPYETHDRLFLSQNASRCSQVLVPLHIRPLRYALPFFPPYIACAVL